MEVKGACFDFASTCFNKSILDLKNKIIFTIRDIVWEKRDICNDVTYFMSSDPSKIEIKSLSERFPLSKKSHQIF